MTGDDLKNWRVHVMDLTQRQAARKLDVSLRHYANMESGRRYVERRTELACVALALGIDVYEFTRPMAAEEKAS